MYVCICVYDKPICKCVYERERSRQGDIENGLCMIQRIWGNGGGSGRGIGNEGEREKRGNLLKVPSKEFSFESFVDERKRG